MKHDEFIGRVQHYARLASRGDAERATRATLETLGERLAGGEPKDLASQLPPEKCTTRQLLKPPSVPAWFAEAVIIAHHLKCSAIPLGAWHRGTRPPTCP